MTATGAGTTDFTKASFGAVAAAIIIVCEANSTNNPEADAELSIGFWDGTNQRVAMVHDEDNQANSVTGRGSDDAFAVMTQDASGSYYTASAITDGIRLTLTTDNTTLQRFCTVILLGGVSAACGTFTPNATQNATQASASLGFAPELIFFLSVGATTADVAVSTQGIWSFGFAASDGTHRQMAWGNSHNQALADNNLLYSETRCVGQVFGGAISWSGEVTTFGADTFTMTTRDGATGSDVCFYLALGGDLSFDCGTLTTPTSTGVDTINTDVAPDAILLALTTASSTGVKTNSEANGTMVGLADADGEFSHNISIEDAATTMNTNSAAQAAAVLDLDSSSGGTRTDLCDATVSSLGATSFALNYSAVDATARKGFWVAFGAAGGGGGDTTSMLTLLGVG